MKKKSPIAFTDSKIDSSEWTDMKPTGFTKRKKKLSHGIDNSKILKKISEKQAYNVAVKFADIIKTNKNIKNESIYKISSGKNKIGFTFTDECPAKTRLRVGHIKGGIECNISICDEPYDMIVYLVLWGIYMFKIENKDYFGADKKALDIISKYHQCNLKQLIFDIITFFKNADPSDLNISRVKEVVNNIDIYKKSQEKNDIPNGFDKWTVTPITHEIYKTTPFKKSTVNEFVPIPKVTEKQ